MNVGFPGFSRWLALASFSVVLSACGGGDDDPVTPASNAYVRVVHASPDAPPVDVDAGGAEVLSDVPYKGASGLLEVPAGDLPLQVRVAGSDTVIEPFTNALPTLVKDTVYTVFAAGKLADIGPLLITEDLSMPEAGKFKLRVVHAAPSTGNVDIYLTAPDADLAAAEPALSNVPFKGDSGVLQVAGGDYRIRITLPGSKEVAFDSGSVNLAAGGDLVVAAVDESGGVAPVSLLVLSRTAAAAELDDMRAAVRAVHASPNAPTVDVTANGGALFPGVSFFAASDYSLVPAAAYDVGLRVTGTDTVALTQNLALSANRHYTVFAVGLAGGNPALQYLVAEDDLMPPAAGRAKVRVVHASPDAPPVDVAANGSDVLTNVPFPAVSDYLEVDAGDYTFAIKATGTPDIVRSVSVNLMAGGIYTVVARGELGGSEGRALTLSLLQDN